MSKIEIEIEDFDRILICSLRAAIETLQELGDEPKRDKKLIDAMELVIKYWGA
jgi:hypothetical protein